jgi:hypothetical protein
MYGCLAASSYGTAVLSHAASAHTKGSWVEIVPSAPNGVVGIDLYVMHGGGSTEYLVDVGIGAAGSEITIAANLSYASINVYSYRNAQVYHIPIAVAAGTRIAVRNQSVLANKTMVCAIGLSINTVNTVSPFAAVLTLGADTANTRGTLVEPGASANTKGAYTQFTASSTIHTKGFLVGMMSGNNSAPAECGWLLDIAVGDSGSEVVIVGDIPFNVHSQYILTIMPVITKFIPVSIPIGTAISMRAQCSTNDVTDRKIYPVLYLIVG